mgnify:FL=1
MDAAEQWLSENDPEYEKHRRGWCNLDQDGEYKTPAQEIPVGGAEELQLLVDHGHGVYVEHPDWQRCRECDADFAPVASWHVFCSEACQQAARPPDTRRRKRAAYVREYRARQKPEQ